jgi:hypothetical protein
MGDALGLNESTKLGLRCDAKIYEHVHDNLADSLI